MRNKTKPRLFVMLMLFGIIWMCLLGRLLWIQVVDVKQFSSHQINLIEEAVSQRKQEVTLHTGRGDIKDRNGYSLTGSETVGTAIFPLVRGHIDERKVDQLAKWLDMNEEKLAELIQNVKEPTFIRDRKGKLISLDEEQAKQIEQLSLPGVIPLPITERYQADAVAKHVIGYISQNPQLIEKDYAEELKNGQLTRKSLIGASGLERSFQPFLQGVGPKTVSYMVDGRGNPLNGIKAKLIEQENPFYPLSIVTTLDKDLQKKVEQGMDEEQIKIGSVVILDAKSRNVLAMASRPDFNPASVQVNKGDWQNRALKQIVPGSIFKTVVAAAVLEEGVVQPDEEFICEGKYGKYGFSCWKEEGHGKLTFSQAYAQSCNITFAQAALRLPGGKLEEYAEKLGVEGRVGWRESPFFKMNSFYQFSGEEAGQIFSSSTPSTDEGVLIQTAIGQRDVQMTPLQVANMLATIADGGVKKQVRIVKEIRYKTGSLFYSFPEKNLPGEKLDRYTAYQLQQMMEEVVERGTGQSLKDTIWKVGGKTGTAQLQMHDETKNNQWFAGFVPAQNPQFIIAVVAEQESPSRQNKAMSLFRKIANELAIE